MRYTVLPSPIGELLIAGDDAGIVELQLPAGKRPQRAGAGWERDDRAFEVVRQQLAEYFAGTRRRFDVPVNAAGTPWQRRVWAALLNIPYGATVSYGKQAAAVGAPTAARAVGLANGQNPIPIIVPCHRVVGAKGSLTGYGGGLDAKRWLLGLEAQHAGLFAG